MLIEIKGTDFRNKGAELMLRSIVAELSGWEPAPRMVVATSTGPYLRRAQLGLFQKFSSSRMFAAGMPDLCRLLPPKFRTRYGIVVDAEVDAVFNATGFAFSSQWGARSTLNLAKAARQWHAAGTRVVLLPQALGPFDAPGMRDAFRSVVEHVDLVYARDEQSYANVMELGVPAGKVRQAPDLTIPVPGRLPRDVRLGARPAAIVPNVQVVERGAADRAAYVQMLARCTQVLAELGFTPFVLVHDSGADREIAQELARGAVCPLEVVTRQDPLELKGIIGACALLVGSRYHALVAALSQNVPVFSVGWSHKYDTLLRGYGCPEHVLAPTATLEEVRAALAPAAADEARAGMVAGLRAANQRYHAATAQMWSEVRTLLAGTRGR